MCRLITAAVYLISNIAECIASRAMPVTHKMKVEILMARDGKHQYTCRRPTPPDTPTHMKSSLLIALICLVIQPVMAKTISEKEKSEVNYAVAASAEMILPSQLIACQAAYPDLQGKNDAIFSAFHADVRQDPEKRPIIEKLQACFAVQPPLTSQQCHDITNIALKLSEQTAWSPETHQLGLDYLNLTRKTHEVLESGAARCLGRNEKSQ